MAKISVSLSEDELKKLIVEHFKEKGYSFQESNVRFDSAQKGIACDWNSDVRVVAQLVKDV